MSQRIQPPAFLAGSFKLGNGLALIAWLPLFFAPSWVLAHIHFWAIPVAIFCAAYVYFLFLGRRHDGDAAPPKGTFTSLGGVVSLFRSPRATLVGWLHYLAFDLMVGLFILQDANQVGISHWWVLPCLILTLMLGPAGLLLYFLIRIGIG